MKTLDPRDLANVKLVEEVIARHAPQWLAQPNIVSLGPAIKLVAGKPLVNTLCICFFVDQKWDITTLEARGWSVVPPEIEGIPTDVDGVAQAPRLLETRSQRYDPLMGGIAVANETRTSVGTLGGIVFDSGDGRRLGLTNEHVLVFTNDGQTGDPVVQPHATYQQAVEIVDAACCPNGQLSFDDVPNPLRDVMAGVAVAAVVAAALSDEIDPHRRGQQATPVAPGERTERERVSVELGYPDFPLPGTAYSIDVNWRYTRITDQGEHAHTVSEHNTNPHVLIEQELMTNRRTYTPGERVIFLAALGEVSRRRERCPERHVVALAVSPSGNTSLSTILRPVGPSDLRKLLSEFGDLELDRLQFRNIFYPRGYAWQNASAGITALEYQGFRLRALGAGLLRLSEVLPDGAPEVVIPPQGVEIRLPHVAEVVSIFALSFHPQDLELEAFDGAASVATASGNGSPVVLRLESHRITRVILRGGGGEALLVAVVTGRRLEGNPCLYWGVRPLLPHAELGLWSTYLLAQTTNDVPEGTPAEEAARTIGGLALTQNLVSGGRRSNLIIGRYCAIDAVADGTFEVVVSQNS